ncbi:isochorismatase [Candidatus Poribacteria bacterium]|nr:MAG: isochorismatase [Candidatus Poribacteria bacterium]
MQSNPIKSQLPIPKHFDSSRVSEVWRIPYQERVNQAREWKKIHDISPVSEDVVKTCLLLVDVQNTFCIPEFELFVAGRSGNGAVEDNVRLCEFIYRNLNTISKIVCTLDTHSAMQIFHEIFWVDEKGNHPIPLQTLITLEDIESGRWRVNPAVSGNIKGQIDGYAWLRNYGEHYVRTLTADGKYPITIWPYHAMLGGIGYSIVSAVDEVCFFHAIAKSSQTHYEIKGLNPLTENYSVLRPEVLEDGDGNRIAHKNTEFLKMFLEYDRLIIAGQAKSHCVVWTISDLLSEIQEIDEDLTDKIYLVEDLTSPVVVPGVVDYTDFADFAFSQFQQAGMHIVKSTEPIDSW